MILINGFINQREFIGAKHYQHALDELENLLTNMTETLLTERLDSMIKRLKFSNDSLQELKLSILKGEKPKAYAAFRHHLNESCINELMSTIADAYYDRSSLSRSSLRNLSSLNIRTFKTSKRGEDRFSSHPCDRIWSRPRQKT